MRRNYLISVYTIRKPLIIATMNTIVQGSSISVSKDICKTIQVLPTLQQFCCSVYVNGVLSIIYSRLQSIEAESVF